MKTSFRVLAATVATAAAAALAACSGAPAATPSDGPTTADTTTYPITIQHAFGSTTIDAEPTRVATVGWGSQEVAIALGITPVGMPLDTWSDDDGDGIAPWTEDALAKLGGATPTLFDETDSIDFEAVASTDPDIILATYSGITEEDYETLSKIAPVIAYPDVAWSTDLEDLILINSEALGRKAQGEALLAGIRADMAAEVAKYPQLAGKKVAYGWFDTTGTFGFYTTLDARANFLTDLGFETPAAVEEAAASGSFYGSISLENIDQVSDIDIYVAYGDEASLEAAERDPLYSKVPAIANGAVVLVPVAGGPFAGATSPAPLATPWVLSDYVAQLAEAADKVK